MSAVTSPDPVVFRSVVIRWQSRLLLWVLRLFLRPWLGRMIRGSPEKITATQLRMSGMRCPNTHGQPLVYAVLGQVPGHVIGDVTETGKPVLLWLHGGAFVLPASPHAHLEMVAAFCARLGAVGFVPDYRLAPNNRYPAALDDCEHAYRALLACGFSAHKVVLGGDSAGGNLALGLLQRIRTAGLPMPACVVPTSPATEMGRIHAPPSRAFNAMKDCILPITALQRVDEFYAGSADASDPELSPLYADCRGFPPMLILASDNEVLMDDSILFARRAHAAGVRVRCEIWPRLPHAFPLFARMFPEARLARAEMLAFMQHHLPAD